MQPGKSPRRWAGTRSIAALALVCAVMPAYTSASAGRLPPAIAEGNGSYVPGEAIVRFASGVPPAVRHEARSAAKVEFEDTLGLPQAQVVSVDGSVKAAVRRLERQPGVAYAQPNYRYEALGAPAPNDTFFGQLWGLSDPALPNPGVGVLDAWESSQGSGEVIAVLDTGVDLTHPDILGNLWTNLSPTKEDLHGYDFVDDDGNPDDYNFHGTHVAGTAAATAGNTQGIAGVAPEAEIMAVRVLDGDGSGSTAEIAAGIDYAAEHGADVINMSLGGPSGSGDKAMSDAIEAAGEANVVVVVAAGNEGANNDTEPHTPCALPEANLICVAALDQSGSLASFSNFGAKSVDIAAPGTSILSAKTDYGPPLFTDGFESGLGLWTTEAFDGGLPWGSSSSAASGSALSATDSPGGDYGHSPNSSTIAESDLFTSAPIDLTGERGCRVHFKTRYEIEPPAPNGELFDGFFAGALAGSSTLFDGQTYAGTSPGFSSGFIREEASVSELDDLSDVEPIFAVLSDESLDFDGAYVDDVRLFCRDQTYLNAIAPASEFDQPNVGSYVEFQGTSMATPHVAGVVALVRAAKSSLNAEEVVNAVLDGASAIPTITPGKRTATEGIADACKAIAVATGGDVEGACPASSEPTPQPSEGSAELSIPDTETPTEFSPAPNPTGPRLSRRPRTFFLLHPPKVIRTPRQKAKAVFRFGASESGVTFLCRVDGAPFRKCPRRFVARFEVGPHTLRVIARDGDGNADRTPAVYRFRVKQVG